MPTIIIRTIKGEAPVKFSIGRGKGGVFITSMTKKVVAEKILLRKLKEIPFTKLVEKYNRPIHCWLYFTGKHNINQAKYYEFTSREAKWE